MLNLFQHLRLNLPPNKKLPKGSFLLGFYWNRFVLRRLTMFLFEYFFDFRVLTP